jgi:hypothetical protein
MGLPPGRAVGRILEAVQTAQLEGIVQTRAEALDLARSLAGKGMDTGPIPDPRSQASGG